MNNEPGSSTVRDYMVGYVAADFGELKACMAASNMVDRLSAAGYIVMPDMPIKTMLGSNELIEGPVPNGVWQTHLGKVMNLIQSQDFGPILPDLQSFVASRYVQDSHYSEFLFKTKRGFYLVERDDYGHSDAYPCSVHKAQQWAKDVTGASRKAFNKALSTFDLER